MWYTVGHDPLFTNLYLPSKQYNALYLILQIHLKVLEEIICYFFCMISSLLKQKVKIIEKA